MTAPITERIATLPDEQAITVLRLVLERRGLTVDPFTAEEQQAHLREALAQPNITEQVTPAPGASEGDVARTALGYLAGTDPAMPGLIEQAAGMAPAGERDPLLLFGVGALVLLAFRADIDLAHEPGKGWRFRFKTKGLSDSTIGKLLGELIGNLINPNP